MLNTATEPGDTTTVSDRDHHRRMRVDALDGLGYTLEDLTDHDAVVCAPPAELVGPSFGELVEVQDRSGARPGARPR